MKRIFEKDIVLKLHKRLKEIEAKEALKEKKNKYIVEIRIQKQK
jgi:hypothetical protein